MRILLVLSLLAISACTTGASQQQASWNEFAYIDPMNLPDYGPIKSLSRPGMY